MTIYNPQGEEITVLEDAWMDGRKHGLRTAINLLQSEARWQWELDARRTVGAQIVAQRIGTLIEVLQNWLAD